MSRPTIVTMLSDPHLEQDQFPPEEGVEVIHNTNSDTNTSQSIYKRVKRLLRKLENQKCLDCGASNPKWVTLISIPMTMNHTTQTVSNRSATTGAVDTFYIGGFCCLECSGAHRRLGTHICFVRSIQLDTLKEHEIQAVERGGNRVINSIYEGNKSSDEAKPHGKSDQTSREIFIRNKYEKKKYLCQQRMDHLYTRLRTRNQYTLCYSNFTTTTNNNNNNNNNNDNKNHHCSILSPTMSEGSGGSTDSDQSSNTKSSSSSSSQVQLQIFTSSPRTLKRIQKYMNPKTTKKRKKKKKKSNGTRNMRFLFFSRFQNKKTIDSKSSIHNVRQDEISIHPEWNVKQPRSVNDNCRHQEQARQTVPHENSNEIKTMNLRTKWLDEIFFKKSFWKGIMVMMTQKKKGSHKTNLKPAAVEGTNEFVSFLGMDENISTKVVSS